MHQASHCTESDNRTNPSKSGNLRVTQQIGKLVPYILALLISRAYVSMKIGPIFTDLEDI